MSNKEVNIIRDSFYNFLCSIRDELPYDEKGSKQASIAIILEEIRNISRKNNGVIDLYAIKPVLRLTIEVLKEYAGSIPVEEEMVRCLSTIEYLQSLVDKIK